jgi:hypothetical protein
MPFRYEFYNCFKKLNDTHLRPRDAFYSELREEVITDEEYKRAVEIWKTCNRKTFKDFVAIYVKSDVL